MGQVQSELTFNRPAPTIDSELVRVSSPSRSDSSGSLPVAHLEQQLWVSQVPAASTTCVGGEGVLLPAQQAAGARGANLPQPVGALLEVR